MTRFSVWSTTLVVFGAYACASGDPNTDNGNRGGAASGPPLNAGASGTPVATAGTGAGGNDGGAGAGTAGVPATTGALLPWKEGNSWTYRVTSGKGTVTTKKTTILPLEPVGGTGPNKDVMANKVITEKADGADETQSWQALVGDQVVRYRELSFDAKGGMVELEEFWTPYKLRVDGTRLTVGTWTEKYTETKIEVGKSPVTTEKTDTWEVWKENERVTVPAGTFDAIVIRRTNASDSAKVYWFVRGIGKVRETGGQMEELVSYELK